MAGNGDDGQHRRVLVCTPSNTAADAFTLELLSSGALPAEQMLRIFAMSKKIEDQNEQLQQHADQLLCICYNEAGIRQFGIPPKEELLKKRVLICTLSASTYLVNGGLEGCFSHIIIDEAGQADELEALIPIVGLTTAHSQGSALQQLRRARGTLQPQQCHSGTRVVLAGDPQQLGPVQVCEQLKRMAKPVSLIERLIGHERDRNFFHFDKRVTTMLEENYRSHPALITVPSQLYYGGKLRSSAPIEEKNSLCQWRNLPKKDFPLFWHSVEELEQCDENGHSYANVAECEIVEQYTTALVKLGVRPEEIGIITPYRYQIKMLRERCRHPKILIDSVERFQGSERRVIIISTVRSTGTGFLDCDKRFNTAVTRPKELLIIVGSSQNMRRIVGWNELIRYCDDQGALMGQTELRVVQKQQQRHKMVPIPPSAMPSRKCRNQLDKVDALGRQLGSLDMADLVRNHRVGKAQNAGLFYRADEHRNRELEEKFIREWEERGRRQQQFYDPSSSSPVYAPSPCSGSSTFHISASQVPSQYLGGSSTTGRNWELEEEEDEGRGSSASDANNNNNGKQLQNSTKKCQIEAYTLEHAIASSGEELELEKPAENGHGKPKSNGDGIAPVKKPVETDEDDFKSCVSSHGHPTPSELEDGELDPSMELDLEEEEDVINEKEQNQQKEKKPADDVLQASSTSNSTSLSCLDQLAELQREMDKLRMQGGFK